MDKKKAIRDISVTGKRVFCRVDFNVPIENGRIVDDKRIRAALPTIQYLIEQKAKVILASHLGRPKGKVIDSLRLDPIAQCLEEHLGMKITKVDEVVGTDVEKMAKQLHEGEILLLENVRFEPGEEKNDPELAKGYARLADLFVNDAFGTAHRAHASTVGVANYVPAVSGLLMQSELDTFAEALSHPKRPFTAIIGGAKVHDKIGILQHLLDKVDHLVIGGGLSFTFLAAQGFGIGKSLFEADKVDVAKSILQEAQIKGVQVYLPSDVVVAQELKPDVQTEIVSVHSIPPNLAAFDIGPETRKVFSDVVKSSKLVIWNGPMGVAEVDCFAEGTNAVAKALCDADAVTIVGGGDSAAAIKKAGLTNRVSHISTGGGATLELLEGKELPGVSVLENKD